jgi:hypothetical protein
MGVDFMKTEIGELLNRTRVLSSAVAWLEAIDTNEKKLIIKSVHEQLQEGIDEDGDIMGVYKEITERITQGRKKAGDPYTLEDTGAFYRSMFVVVLIDAIIIDGQGQKSPIDNLFAKFGEGIVGLTPQNMDKLRKRLKTKYIDYVRKVLQLD